MVNFTEYKSEAKNGTLWTNSCPSFTNPLLHMAAFILVTGNKGFIFFVIFFASLLKILASFVKTTFHVVYIYMY